MVATYDKIIVEINMAGMRVLRQKDMCVVDVIFVKEGNSVILVVAIMQIIILFLAHVEF